MTNALFNQKTNGHEVVVVTRQIYHPSIVQYYNNVYNIRYDQNQNVTSFISDDVEVYITDRQFVLFPFAEESNAHKRRTFAE